MPSGADPIWTSACYTALNGRIHEPTTEPEGYIFRVQNVGIELGQLQESLRLELLGLWVRLWIVQDRPVLPDAVSTTTADKSKYHWCSLP